MSSLKKPHIGVYGPNTRALQRRLSFEHVSLTWKTANVFRYLGSRASLSPTLTDIQDVIFLETRDRAYPAQSVPINVWYDPLPEQAMDFAQFGIINPIGNEQKFKFHINSFDVDGLGRYLVAGDILEIPFLLQDGFPTRYEVTDVDRKLEFENFYVYVTGVIMSDKQETEEIQNQRTMTSVLSGVDTAMDALTSSQVPFGGVTGVQTSLSQVLVTNAGTGYTTAPTVVFTGGGYSTLATAIAFMAGGSITQVNITNPGLGYTSLPTVSFTGGGGTGALAVATIVGAANVTDSSTAPYNPRETDPNQTSFLDNPDNLDF